MIQKPNHFESFLLSLALFATTAAVVVQYVLHNHHTLVIAQQGTWSDVNQMFLVGVTGVLAVHSATQLAVWGG